MEISISRAPPLGQELRRLPAAEYNLARMLQTRSPRGVAFIPIRRMQILAILDAEEFVFVDSQHKQLAVLAWRGFRPQARASLDDPVPFDAMFHREDARELQRQLQPEFFKAMQALVEKNRRIEGPPRVLKFERPTASKGAKSP